MVFKKMKFEKNKESDFVNEQIEKIDEGKEVYFKYNDNIPNYIWNLIYSEKSEINKILKEFYEYLGMDKHKTKKNNSSYLMLRNKDYKTFLKSTVIKKLKRFLFNYLVYKNVYREDNEFSRKIGFGELSEIAQYNVFEKEMDKFDIFKKLLSFQKEFGFADALDFINEIFDLNKITYIEKNNKLVIVNQIKEIDFYKKINNNLYRFFVVDDKKYVEEYSLAKVDVKDIEVDKLKDISLIKKVDYC